jgi:phosphate transport system substrate-binding protein
LAALIILKLATTAVLAFFSFITGRLVLQYFPPETAHAGLIVIGAFFLLFLILVLTEIVFWWKRFRFPALKILGVIVIVLVGVRFGFEIYTAKEESITIRERIADRREYLPFDEDSAIARLPFPPGIRFTEDLPVVDGAESLFSLYSAFVNALYPETIPPLNNGGGPFRFLGGEKGMAALTGGETDIRFGYYPESAREVADSAPGYSELVWHRMGKDALIFFVNKNNPIDNLSSEDIRRIYDGDVTNWKELGGADEAIVAYQRAPDSESQIFMKEFMGIFPLRDPPKTVIQRDRDPDRGIPGGPAEVPADYRNEKNAVGYSLRFFSMRAVKDYDIKLLSVDGIPPTLETIKNETYPLVVPIYAIRRGDNRKPNVDQFVEWILFEEGQYLIEKSGFAPLN